jgi:thiamine kinase-like enzyme
MQPSAQLAGILARLEPLLGVAEGELVALDGGITNRNYRVRFGGREYVVRLPGKDTALLGISRDAERIANAAAATLGIAPTVAAAMDDCLVTRYVRCRAVSAEELRAAPEAIATALRRFHDSGTELPARFWVPELLDSYASVTLQRGGALPEPYEHARDAAARIAAVLPLSDPVPCHDDLLTANLIVALGETGAPSRLMLVDWEYAGIGHRLFDLGNLAVNNDFDEIAEQRLLRAYLGREPRAGELAALRLMRVMSDAREAAWGVVQSTVSELDFDFSAYAARHFERLTRATSDPRFQEWLGAATA